MNEERTEEVQEGDPRQQCSVIAVEIEEVQEGDPRQQCSARDFLQTAAWKTY